MAVRLARIAGEQGAGVLSSSLPRTRSWSCQRRSEAQAGTRLRAILLDE